MIEPDSYNRLKKEIADRMEQDRVLLDQLCSEIRVLCSMPSSWPSAWMNDGTGWAGTVWAALPACA